MMYLQEFTYGGIAVNNEYGGNINNCKNEGNILVNSIKSSTLIVEVGGIARIMNGQDGKILNCYNSGNFEISATNVKVIEIGRNSGQCR